MSSASFQPEMDDISLEEAVALGHDHRGPCAIASGNGREAVRRAIAARVSGMSLVDAAVEGVAVAEDDPNDVSVGFGGLPNADGVVECDACVMDSVEHAVGAVGALRGIRHASKVALAVMRHSPHSLLAGDGALAFARSHGFVEENLLTDRARQAWERWRDGQGSERLSDEDRWELGDTHGAGPAAFESTTGTIHLAICDDDRHLAACTTTSGLSFKHPGRMGDSPLCGAGIYLEDGIGSAGCTGRGESALDTCASFDVVRQMERGADPTDACLRVLRRVVRLTKSPRLRDDHGRPSFNITLYALRADGAFGAASMWSGYRYCVHNGSRARVLPAAYLFLRAEG